MWDDLAHIICVSGDLNKVIIDGAGSGWMELQNWPSEELWDMWKEFDKPSIRTIAYSGSLDEKKLKWLSEYTEYNIWTGILPFWVGSGDGLCETGLGSPPQLLKRMIYSNKLSERCEERFEKSNVLEHGVVNAK